MQHELHPALAATGRFKVRHCLGTGGFGIVFAAYDVESNAEVALKWLRNSDATTIARFKREFRALADISHPNLVSFRELLTVGGEWFFTMDLVSGVELLDWVCPASPAREETPTSTAEGTGTGSTIAVKSVQPASSGTRGELDPLEGASRPLTTADLPRLRSTLEQLAAGLSALHAAGMLHRDVKPSNVLVTREGRVVLLDFGLVTELDSDGKAATITGNIVGTPAYMAPEQAMGLPVSHASDWYSVGAIMFQALTGKLPFEGDPHHVLVRKQMAEAPPPSHFVRGVPRLLSELCTDLLSRAPERRPNGEEFIARLRAALPVGASSPEGPTPSSPTFGAISSPNPGTAFVGRETHLWALDEAREEAEHQKTVVSLVHGPSGMGKSSLVRHFLDNVRRERPETVILEGRCYERESMPYKALDSLVDSLCRYLQRLPEVEAAKLLPRDVQALARVFPVFLHFEGAAGRRARARADAVQERRRAFEALRELLARVADHRPLVLFIDDLQWGDGDSEPLLTALLRPPEPPALLFIAAYRSEDAAASPLVHALRKLAATGPPIEVCEIPVGELSPEASRELASSLLGESDDAKRAAALARESYGSPLFMRQLAALGGTVEKVDFAAAVTQRVSALGADARRLLQTLAVSGRPLALATAARVAGIDHDAQAVLAKLKSETLVRSRGIEARDQIEIYHDRIRQIVVAALSEEELKALHHKLARVLSSAGEGEPDALAAHFLAAGDRSLAAEYAEEAAERALGALAFARAAQMYEMAIEVGSTLGKNAASLRLKLAEALVAAGRGHDAAERFLQAARENVGADAIELRRRAAEQLLFTGRIEEGLKVVEQVLSAIKMRVPKTTLGALLSLLFRRLLLRLRGVRFRERSVDRLARDELVRIDTCFSVGLGLGMIDPIRGADFQTRYLVLALASGEPLRIARGLALEAAYRAADGVKAKPAIDALLAKARSIAQRVGQAHVSAMTSLMSGVAYCLLGDYARAVDLCDAASVELTEKCTGVAWELDNAAFFAGFSLLGCGRIRELAERVPALLDDARARGDHYGEVLLRLQCSWFVHLANDDDARAEADLAVISETWSKDKFLLQHAWRMVNAVEVALYAGDARRARAVLEDAAPRLRRSLFLRAESMRARTHNVAARAALAAADGAKDAAERSQLVDEAAREADALAKERWLMAKGYALLAQAGVAALRGDRARAIERCEAALGELEERGARLYAAAARMRLGELRGGDEGDALVLQATKAMADERIAQPAKMARVFAPWTATAERRKG